MRHLVIGRRQKARNFSAFHWSPHGCLITIGQHFVTTRVVHLPKRTETTLITESDQSRANHQLLQLWTVRTAWSESDQAVLAVHSCKSWLIYSIESLFSLTRNLLGLECYLLPYSTVSLSVLQIRRGNRNNNWDNYAYFSIETYFVTHY